MLTPDMRISVIKAIQNGGLTLKRLIAILEFYYMRSDFTEEELQLISTLHQKVVDGEIGLDNYMEFFNGLHEVRRTDRFDVESGVLDLLAHKDEIKNIK